MPRDRRAADLSARLRMSEQARTGRPSSGICSIDFGSTGEGTGRGAGPHHVRIAARQVDRNRLSTAVYANFLPLRNQIVIVGH